MYIFLTPVSVNKNGPPEERTGGKTRLSGQQIRGWRAVSTAGLQGKGSFERSVFSETPASP